MGKEDHYIFMDGCVVKGCKPKLDFDFSFGQYADLLEDLYRQGGWGRGEHRLGPLPLPGRMPFTTWRDSHVHTAQSTQNIGTGARRIDALLRAIPGQANIHLLGTSAAGSAILEYFLLTDPDLLYVHDSDPSGRRRPAPAYRLDPRIASITTIDAPTNWVPLLRNHPGRPADGAPRSLGRYLARRTRVKAGANVPPDVATTRTEDVPLTWISGDPVAGLVYDNQPHYDGLPPFDLERHIYTGKHMSQETRAFLERVWR